MAHASTVLVTGATSGIGLATAIALARRGAEVIVHGRSAASAAAAVAALQAAVPGAVLRAVHADLASLGEVRALAEQLAATPPDVVIHNAGLERWERQVTSAGHELTLAVNHLAPYLSTRLLAPHLRSGARVVFVSSLVHAWGTMHWDDLMAERWYAPEPVYYQSKLAAALGADALARRLVPRGIDVFLVPPGLTRTSFGRDFRGAAAVWARAMGALFFRAPETVAEELCDAALAPRFAGLGLAYLDRGAVRLPAARARVEVDVRRLDEVSSELVGLPVEALGPPVPRPELSPPALGPWVRSIALGEMLGFGVPVLVALVGVLGFGSPDTVFGQAVALVVMSAAGVAEGLLFGHFTARALSPWLPDLDRRRFVGATAAIAASAWALGMSVPLYFTAFPPEGASAAVGSGPSDLAVAAFASVFGGIAGAIFGLGQAPALRPHVRRVGPWIAGQAAGWAIGLPISYLVGGLGTSAPGALAALGVLAGLGMGTSVALTTFAATRRMR